MYDGKKGKKEEKKNRLRNNNVSLLERFLLLWFFRPSHLLPLEHIQVNTEEDERNLTQSWLAEEIFKFRVFTPIQGHNEEQLVTIPRENRRKMGRPHPCNEDETKDSRGGGWGLCWASDKSPSQSDGSSTDQLEVDLMILHINSARKIDWLPIVPFSIFKRKENVKKKIYIWVRRKWI